MHEFDSKDLKRLFGIPASQVRSLIKAGHIKPLRVAGRLNYSFQDLIVLRTLGTLRAAKIPTQKINRTLRAIRESLPGELPLSGLSIVAVGDRIVVREGQSLRESDTGQYTLALDFIDQGGDLLMIDKRTVTGGAAGNDASKAANTASASKAANTASASNAGNTKASNAANAANTANASNPSNPSNASNAASGAIDDDFERALALEESDAEAAIALYRACLAADAKRTEARLNLGRLLHEQGRLGEAEGVYRGSNSAEPLLSFNLAVLLEDLDRTGEAMAVYRHAIALDPGLADAHFNLARLCEQAGNARDALRHLLAYRRLRNA
jgi:DNA-binding transcriptional MerR regulator